MNRQYYYYMERNRDRVENDVLKECNDIDYAVETETVIETYRKEARR